LTTLSIMPSEKLSRSHMLRNWRGYTRTRLTITPSCTGHQVHRSIAILSYLANHHYEESHPMIQPWVKRYPAFTRWHFRCSALYKHFFTGRLRSHTRRTKPSVDHTPRLLVHSHTCVSPVVSSGADLDDIHSVLDVIDPSKRRRSAQPVQPVRTGVRFTTCALRPSRHKCRSWKESADS
jgi:hypothetical protein